MATLKDSVVSGSLRVTDTLYSTTAQFQILRAPTTSGGTTYGPGTNGNFLKSNGTSVYWVSLSTSDIPTISITDKTGGTLTAARGGTGISTYTIGDILYSNAANSLSKLSGNTTTTRKFLRSVATTSGTAVAPAWDTVTKTDVGLSNVENTALSTWTGTNKITTVGTISTGTWQGTAIAASYIGNHSTDKLTSGTLPVGRGGTGVTAIANIQAGKDGDGNTISSTYLKLSGGTLTGNLTIGQASDTTERQIMAHSAAGRIYLYAQGSTTGSKGLYSYNASGIGGGILAINQNNQISAIAPLTTPLQFIIGNNNYSSAPSDNTAANIARVFDNNNYIRHNIYAYRTKTNSYYTAITARYPVNSSTDLICYLGAGITTDGDATYMISHPTVFRNILGAAASYRLTGASRQAIYTELSTLLPSTGLTAVVNFTTTQMNYLISQSAKGWFKGIVVRSNDGTNDCFDFFGCIVSEIHSFRLNKSYAIVNRYHTTLSTYNGTLAS